VEHLQDIEILLSALATTTPNWTAKGADAIINCAGVLPGRPYRETVLTNALGPHNLARFGIRLIHMSTDCVFSGRKYPTQNGYGLDSGLTPDPTDLYGRTKLAGEPSGDHVLVVRGSFIGEGAGFLGWLLSAKGQVDAWERAHWNGTSVAIMAEQLVILAEGRRTGIAHVASPTEVTKAFMITYLQEQLDLPIEPVAVAEPAIWRVLWPDIEVPPVEDMLHWLVGDLR
jgi:dTDP-4-dehydrorhamnose reductase